MRHKRFRVSDPVVCDRCGQMIEEGEKALLRYDERRGRAFFYHAHCPVPGDARFNPVPGGCRRGNNDENKQD